MDKTICVFGDSVTLASYVTNCWVDQLRRFLEKKHDSDFIHVFNLGVGGNTTDDVLVRFKPEASVRAPTHIVFAVGVNDSGYFRIPDKPIVEEQHFKDNMKQLITQAKEITKDVILIGLVIGDDSILKPLQGSSKGKSYDRTKVERYNQILKELAELNNCSFIPLLDKLDFEDFSDGLHPNDSGHKKMFDEIKNFFVN